MPLTDLESLQTAMLQTDFKNYADFLTYYIAKETNSGESFADFEDEMRSSPIFKSYADFFLFKIAQVDFSAIGGGGSSLPTQLAFNTAIPFTYGLGVMNKIIDSSINFTVNSTGAVNGCGVLLTIQANGADEPTFTGFTKLSTSDTFNNTLGRVHEIVFCMDGAGNYIYSISQVKTNTVTYPVVISRTTGTTYDTIKIVYSEIVTGTSAGYSFKKNGSAFAISSMTGSGTNTLTFTMAASILPSDTLLASYNSGTGDTIDASSEPAGSFTDGTVTNSLAFTFVDFPTNIGLAQTGNIWADTLGGTAGSYNAYGLGNKRFDSGRDGMLLFQYNGVQNVDALMGLNTTLENAKYTSYEVFLQPTASLIVSHEAVATSVAKVVGTYYGYRRIGGVLQFISSTDGGTTITVINTVTAFTGSTGTLYVGANCDSGKQVENVISSNLI